MADAKTRVRQSTVEQQHASMVPVARCALVISVLLPRPMALLRAVAGHVRQPATAICARVHRCMAARHATAERVPLHAAAAATMSASHFPDTLHPVRQVARVPTFAETWRAVLVLVRQRLV